MAAMTKLPEPPFYALPDLAIAWGISLAQVQTYAEWGAGSERLEVRQCELSGVAIPGVMLEEKRRFESLRQPKRFPEGRFNPSDKASHQALIAALLLICYGKNSELLLGPYELANQVEQDAAGLGLGLDRSRETNAKIMREAQNVLKQAGVTRGIKTEHSTEREQIQTLEDAA